MAIELNGTTGITSPSYTGDGAGLTGVSAPAGSIIYYAGNTAPSEYIKANGAAISRTTYADLFSAIGTTFGAGDGSTTFLVPDLRGEFLRGWDDSRGVDSGRSFGSYQADDFKAHVHSKAPGTLNNWFAIYARTGNWETERYGMSTYEDTNSTGGADTRPRNIALLACIKI